MVKKVCVQASKTKKKLHKKIALTFKTDTGA